ncbi:MAG: acetylxylan esterase [Candidatus Poribacteria bacterium]|nr:acetylxylan esterase [Candidatus Poribacteria bacterium]
MSAQNDLAVRLRSLQANIFSADERKAHTQMLRDDLQRRCNAVNQRDKDAWAQIKSKAAWERFCAPRIEALRQSLGVFPETPTEVNVHVTRTVEGDGYCIENLVYESRPGVSVTANLYLPSPLQERMPAILIVHSHHNPKTQGELQDMGMTWARSGCMVLVMDQFSYGERRQHPAGPRQDYHFRYITGIQLHLLGDSLMGWMVWDVMRGVDLLLNRPDVDKEQVILMGAVAGGGDPAAVAAALDARVTCAIPFNFGGPQPETTYPLPDDPEETFNYMGAGGWESTRNLRLSGRDEFLPWMVVGSVAPRHLVYAHEFSWDKARDPVWKRLQQVFAFYAAADNLAFTHGAGLLSGRPPEATHCNNIGDVHRKPIHSALQRWFGIPIPQEYENRLPDETLMCRASAPLRPLHELFAEIGESRAVEMRDSLAELAPNERRERLRREWAKLLGNVEPKAEPVIQSRTSQQLDGVCVERIVLEVETNIVVPMLMLLPTPTDKTKLPLVVGLSQHGKEQFMRERAAEIAEVLEKGAAVCLPDVRGTGETSPNGSRERQSEATSISATELMLGQTLLGSRLRDLRSVFRYLRKRDDLDSQRLALWGDSFAPTNPTDLVDPLIPGRYSRSSVAGESPHQSEPLGGLLALFGALYEEAHVVVARGTIAGYQSVLRNQFCYIPHDAIVPGALTAGDLCDVAAALAPRSLRLEGLVSGRNCPMSDGEIQRLFAPTLQAYRASEDKLSITPILRDDLSAWLVRSLNKG